MLQLQMVVYFSAPMVTCELRGMVALRLNLAFRRSVCACFLQRLVHIGVAFCCMVPCVAVFPESRYPLDEIAVPLCAVAVELKVFRSRQDLSGLLCCDRAQRLCTNGGAWAWQP